VIVAIYSKTLAAAPRFKVKSSTMKHLPALLVLLALVLACGQSENASKPANNANAPADAAPVRVDAVSLVKAYRENEVAADGQFRGRVLEVTGKIETISETLGTMRVDLAGVDYVTVKCQFAEEDRPEIVKLKKGQTVTLAGTGDGMTGGLYVDVQKCKVK
jgi:hypothetical protein